MNKLISTTLITALALLLGTSQLSWANCGSCGTHAKSTKHAHGQADNSALVCGCPASEASLKAHHNMSVLEIAEHAGKFNTLLTAINKAGLQDVLAGSGPFTIFAPSDEAFAKLPDGQLDKLLKNKTGLKSVLTYHVHQGQLNAEQIAGLSSLSTINGQSASVAVGSDGLKIDQALLVSTDIQASNGIIHVIDHVNLPPEMTSLLD